MASMLDSENKLVNTDLLEQIKSEHIKEFEAKLNDLEESDKDRLFQILQSFLDGNLPKKCFAHDNAYFDMEKNLDKTLLDSLSEFNNKYFEKPVFDTENNSNYEDNVIIVSVERLKKSYEEFFNPNIFNENPKKIMVRFQKLGENYHKAQLNLEYVVLIDKLKKFIQIVKMIYPYVDNFNELYKIMTLEQINFNDFLDLVIKPIKDYFRHLLNSRAYSSKEESYILIKNMLGVENNINSIFWIVYRNDFKFVDNYYRIYNLNESSIDTILKQLETKCGSTDSADFESDIEKFMEFLDLIESKFNSQVQTIVSELKESEPNLSEMQIDNILDEQIQLILSELDNPDDIELIKSQLLVSRSIIKLSFGLDNFMERLKDIL